MAVFGVKLDDTVTARKYISKVRNNLARDNLLKNPFNGSVREFGWGENYFLVVNMQPLYPNPFWLGVVFSLVMLLFGAPWGLWVFPILMFVGAFFHSRLFLFLMFRMGLRRNGYAGDVKLLRNKRVIELLVRVV